MPLVIVAVTVSYVASARLTPRSAPAQGEDDGEGGDGDGDGTSGPLPHPRRPAVGADPARPPTGA